MGWFDKISNAFDTAKSNLDKGIKINLLGAEAIGKLGVLDFKGALNKVGKAGDILGLTPQGSQAGSELDLSTPTADQVEEQNKKKLLELSRLNAPGLSSQSVLNLR